MKRALASCLVVVLAGCLSNLDQPPGEDGGGPGGGDGGSPDAIVPTDTDIRITTLVTDLDLEVEAFPDLVLLNDAPMPGERSVQVYFDTPSGFFGEPDQVLSTEMLHPLVAATGDFIGGALHDVMVIARDDDDVPYVILFEQDTARSFVRAASTSFPGRTIGGGTVSMPEPVFAAKTYIQESMEVNPGLVFGDLDMALSISITDWGTVSAADDRPLVTGSSTMNLAIPVPSAQVDRNDLLVLDNQGGIWLKNDGGVPGDFGNPTDLTALWPDHQRAFFAFDVMGDDAPDFMTLDGADVSVGEVTWSGDVLDVTVRQMDQSPLLGDGRGDALFATDMDDIGGMDLLILDDIEPPADDTEHFQLLAARNIMPIDTTTISPMSGMFDSDVSHAGSPTRLVAGDFNRDGDVEVWVFDQTLDFKMCLVGEIYQTNKMRFNECP